MNKVAVSLMGLLLIVGSVQAGWDVQFGPDGNGGAAAGLAFTVQFDEQEVSDLDLEPKPAVTVNGAGGADANGSEVGWWSQNWPWVAVPVLGGGGYALVAKNNDYWPFNGQKDDKSKTEIKPAQATYDIEGDQLNISMQNSPGASLTINFKPEGEGNGQTTTHTHTSQDEVAGGNP